MKEQTFEALKGALAEAVAIEAGTAVAPLERVYVGDVLVEIRENGETTWRLADAHPDVAAVFAEAGAPDVAALRDQLRQTQPGMATLLGVSVATYRNWEQRRRQPEGPALSLIRIAASRPDALVSALPANP